VPHFPGFDTFLVLWGMAVLAFSSVRHFYFGGTCIQIDPPRHPSIWTSLKKG
jgi:hypothetical protein